MSPIDSGSEGEDNGSSWDTLPSQIRRRKRRFNLLLIESICESTLFGENILRFLEMTTPVKREELSDRLDIFVKELEELLGEGARMLSKEIVKNLYNKLGLKFDDMEDVRDMPRYVRHALNVYLDSLLVKVR